MGKKQSNLVVTKDLLKNGWKVAGIFLATRVCPTWQGVLPFETSAFCCLFKTHFTPNAPPFNSFTSVEKQLVVWCPHLPERLQVPCKLSLGSQDVSSGNTNTITSLQDKKMFGGYKTSKNNYWLPLGNAGLLTAKYRFNKPTNTQENDDDERAKYLFHDKSTSSVSTYFCVKRKEVKDHLTPCTLYPLY